MTVGSSTLRQPKRPTLRDVAAIAGVDPSVASRVLNGQHGRVRPETLVRIQSAARQLGYAPHPVARSLILGRTMMIGLLIPSFTNPAYASMIAGAQQAAADAGYVTVITDTGDDEDAMSLQIDRLVGAVDGIIMASVRLGGAAISRLALSKIPFVLLNRRASEAGTSVSADDEQGVRLAVQHLAAFGHRRIGHVAGTPLVETSVRRREAFERALKDFGLKADPSLVIETELTEAGGEESFRALLAIPPIKRPTAVFCVNLVTALGALRLVEAGSLEVPRDLSLIAFDDVPLADHLRVPLTTVRMPNHDMGARAVEVLLEILDGAVIPKGEVVTETPPSLVERASVAPPARLE